MVPTHLVVLDALPLTPSGKVDRSALPPPPRATVHDRQTPRSDSERLVAELYRDLLGLDALPGPSDDFFALGGHSLLAVELLAEIRGRLGFDPGPGILFTHPTVAGLGRALDAYDRAPNEVSSASGAGETAGLAPIVELTRAGWGVRAPLYCIHPAGGISWCYRTLADVLDPPRPVVGVQAVGLDVDRPLPESLGAMAADYVGAILERHPGGPIHLLGWSVGGIIAHEMAIRLRALGRAPGALVLLDAYPADVWRDEPEPDDRAALEALLIIAGQDPASLGAEPLSREVVRARLREAGHVLGALSDRALDGVVRVVALNNRLVRRHRHGRLESDVIHFRAGLDHENDDFDASMWDPYVRSVVEHVIPAVHAHMTGPSASRRIATVLTRTLEEGRRPARVRTNRDEGS